MILLLRWYQPYYTASPLSGEEIFNAVSAANSSVVRALSEASPGLALFVVVAFAAAARATDSCRTCTVLLNTLINVFVYFFISFFLIERYNAT